MKVLKQKEFDKLDPLLKNEHPRNVFSNIILNINFKDLFQGTKFQKERDLFIGCLFAFYLRKLQGREWYIQRISDPPDFELIAPTNRVIKDKPFDRAEIEIVQIPERIKTLKDAIGIIKSRKIDRPYDLGEGIQLLVFINNNQGPSWLEGLINFFSDSRDKFSEIWSIYFIPGDINNMAYEVHSLRPSGWWSVLKVEEELYRKSIPHPLLDKFMVKIE